MKKLFLFFTLTFLGAASFAQELSSTIFDSSTGLPISNANVFVQETNDGVFTDKEGKFTIGFGANGTYTFVVSHIGYDTKTFQFSIGDGWSLEAINLTPRVNNLNANVVVTAQRTERTQFEVPEAVSVLKAAQIRRNVSRSMAEAMIGVPGVWMQKTNHGGGSPFVRGLTGNQTLLLLDGIRLNNSTYRYGPNQYFNTIDVLNVRQVEVVRGAGSVLYGSDALGGAIQVFTGEPQFSLGGSEFGGEVLGRILTNDMEQGGRGYLDFASERVAIRGGLTFRNFGDLVAGGDLGTQAPSAYQEVTGDFKAKFKLGTKNELTLAYNGLFQSDVGRYDQVAQRGYQSWQFNPQNRQLAYARLILNGDSKIFKKINLTASYQNSLEGRERQRVDSDIFNYDEDEVNTLGASFQFNSILGEKWTAVSGVELYNDKINSFKEDTDLSTGNITPKRGLYPDDSKATNVAVFTSHTFDLSALTLNVGARFNYFSLNIEDAIFGDTDLEPTALVGNISARYAIDDYNAIVGSINTGFRAPNINDLSSFGSFDFGIEVPTSDLSPERTLTFELGYKLKRDRLAANFTAYNTQLLDLIGRIPGTFNGQPTFEGEDVYVKSNIDESTIWGFEFDGRVLLNEQFSLEGSLIYTKGEDADNLPMRRIPPLNGRFAFNFQSNSGFFSQLEWWYANMQDRLSGGDISDHRIPDGGTPGWNVLNLKIGYEKNNIGIHGGLQNIFDEAYRIHGSGVDGAGFHGWLSLAYKF